MTISIGKISTLNSVLGRATLLLAGILSAAGAVEVNNERSRELTNSQDVALKLSQPTIFPTINNVVRNLFPGFQLVSEPETKPDYATPLRQVSGFEQRDIYIQNALRELNPELLPGGNTALEKFNRNHNLALACQGIKIAPYEFVFIDNNYFLGKSDIPVRISLSYDEVTNTKSEDQLIQLLEEKLRNHYVEMENQHRVWQKPYSFDFPKNNGACMFALTLNGLSGMESDLVKSLDVYQKYYGMSVEALCVDEIHEAELKKELSEGNFNNLPKMTKATKAEILSQFEKALRKAIDEKKEIFVFHYLAHGSSDGSIWASDTSFLPSDISEVMTKNHNGRPICEQIDVAIWAGSCYSGIQLDGMKKYFQERKNIPVKNLKIITESNYTTAGAGTTPFNASLVSDLMVDNSGPLDYYRSWYKEYLAYLEKQDAQINKKGYSYLNEVRFADLMSQYDTYNKQDSQGFHYSNDPVKNTTDEQYFTQFNPLISYRDAKL